MNNSLSKQLFILSQLLIYFNKIFYLSLRFCSYLDGRHLSITSPAESREFQGAVAESNRSAVQHGPLLNLKLQMMEVWEVMIWTRPADRARLV